MSDHTAPIPTAVIATHPQPGPDATLAVAPAVPDDATAQCATQNGETRVDGAIHQDEKEHGAEQAAEAAPDNNAADEIAFARVAQDAPCALASAMTDAILPDHDLDQKDSARWRACRCNHKPSVTAQEKTTVQQKATVQQQRGSALWPYVVVVLALAGALVLAVWLDDPAGTASISAGTIGAGLAGVNTTLDVSRSPAPLINATAPTANGHIDETDDDKDWCACLCQPKGPLLAGRIVDDQCVCHCLAPTQQPPSPATYHSYAVCVATIVQMGSFLVAAIALGCILTF
nr:hypothetical protein [Pandoravirus aubagnensis]